MFRSLNINVHDSAQRLPSWLRKPVRDDEEALRVRKILKEYHLHTVCQSAGCPNKNECFHAATATFMILGDVCMRHCRFCGVDKGRTQPLDPDEPERIGEAAARLGLQHVVITSVTRDDLPDGGADHFARTVRAVRNHLPKSTIEVLIPDFQGNEEALLTVLNSGIDVLNHNVETVPRLYPAVRPEADFKRSLTILQHTKFLRPSIKTKTGLMLGLGESEEEVFSLFDHLAEVKCQMLTIGQYLAPNRNAFPVQTYIHPAQFQRYKEEAIRRGVGWVMAGPLVRSSYHAEELFKKSKGDLRESSI
ncbi:lipoyl synthase [candidate division KSB1 bacterium]|nr:lipoyl synthase [candidate division KSB1 bacterium]